MRPAPCRAISGAPCTVISIYLSIHPSILCCVQAQLMGNKALDAADRTVVESKLRKIGQRLMQLASSPFA